MDAECDNPVSLLDWSQNEIYRQRLTGKRIEKVEMKSGEAINNLAATKLH